MSKTNPKNYYTRPLGESDLDSEEVTDSENSGNEGNLRIPKRLLGSDTSSSLPTVNSNLNPRFASQSDERGLGEDEEQTQFPKDAPNESDMEEEEMGTEKMWKMRANRVKQILSALEFGPFNRSKKFGLQFNVGFGPKRNFSVDSLPDSILLEIAKFALAMNSSQQNFIMEILEYNFDISLESEYQRHSFTSEIMNRDGTDHLLGCNGEVEGVVPRCTIWYNEKELLSDVEEHLKCTITQCEPDIKVPLDDFDGKVTYGQRKALGGGNYKGHVEALAPTVQELATLEREAQSSFLHLGYMLNQLFRAF
ncbi:hypothetical protein VZT92_011080 [Zoarces viviparus]|uniref:Uncharacterized protein n=1 Tax=Zoarces viviparus TaxID=48416 RepID=A0AAW1FB00_ZOAVI